MTSQDDPSTPARQPKTTLSTPRSAMTKCTSEASDFDVISIHTAKCAVCDKRNASDQMRRCRGCCWQICQPCQQKREEKGTPPLQHGFRLGTPPQRPNLTSSAKKESSPATKPASSPATKPSAYTVTKPSSSKGKAPVKEDSEAADWENEDDTPSPFLKRNKGFPQDVTPPTSAERAKYNRRAKPTGSLQELEKSEDEFFDPEESPTNSASTKRPMTSKDRPTNEPSTKRPRKSGEPSTSKAEGKKKADPSKGDNPKVYTPKDLDVEYRNIGNVPPLRPGANKHILEELSRRGTDKGGRSESFLARQEPVSFNREVRIPRRISTPRKTVDDIHQGIVAKVREKLGMPDLAASVPAASGAASSSGTTSQRSVDTVGGFVETQVRDLRHGMDLDKDQQDVLVWSMTIRARKFAVSVISKMPTVFRKMVSRGLDLGLDHLTDEQKHELGQLLQNEVVSQLKDFADEASLFRG